MTSTPAKRGALAGLALPMLMASLGTSIANVGLPSMGEAFAASFEEVQWIVLAYLLASTTLVVGAGRLGDIAGRRRLLLAGLVIFTLASALCAAAPSVTLLVAGRALQGLGAAFMLALSMALVGEAVPQARTGSAMGLLGTMSAVGTALGPTLGGVLVASFGWRALFLVNLPLGLLAVLLAYRHLPPDRARQAGDVHFDALGTSLLGLALGAYALALTVGRDGFSTLNTALVAAALLAAGLFLRVEGRAAVPLLRLEMLRQRALGAGLGMSLLVSTVMMTTLVVGPFLLSQGLGLTTALVGLTMSVGPLVAAVAGVPAGRLVDRLGDQAVIMLGLVLAASGAALLAVMPGPFGTAGYAGPLVVLTAGYALFQTANNTAVMRGVSQEQRGVVSGMLSLSRNLGLVTGASAMGAVFAWARTARGEAASPAGAAVAGAQLAFGAASLLIIAALAIALASRGKVLRDAARSDRHGERRETVLGAGDGGGGQAGGN